MRASDLTVRVRDAALLSQVEVDEFSSLEMVLRFNAADTYLLTVPARSAAAEALAQPKAGVVVYYRDVPMMSGPVRHRGRTRSDGEDSFTVGGPDDSQFIGDRLVEPCAPPYTAQAYDAQTGAAETVIHHYVNVNAGPGARTGRPVPFLTLAPDLARGTSVDVNGRFDQLDTFISNLALIGGDLGWRVLQSGTSLVFSVYVPRDLTGSALFSLDMGNMGSFNYTNDAAKANAILGGGSGDGTARIFDEIDDAGSIAEWGRIEFFLNDTSATTLSILADKVTADLTAKAEQTLVTLTPTDIQNLAFGADYFLGDRVTAVVDGLAFPQIVREVDIKVASGAAVTVTPLVGTPGTTATPPTFAAIRAAHSRIGTLERT